MAAALDGLLVVSLEQAVAAPYCASPPGRCRRAGHQGRAAGGRLRPGLRPGREGRERLLRLAQSWQAVDRPRHQAGRATRPCWPSHDGGGGCLSSRTWRPARPRAPVSAVRSCARAASAADHLRHQRLWRRAAPTPEMKAYDLLVQAESGLGRGDRPAGGAGPRRRVGLRHCRRNVRDHAAILGDAAGATERRRRGPGHRGLPVRRHGRLDDRAAAASGLWRRGAGAGRAGPPLNRALRRLCLQPTARS